MPVLPWEHRWAAVEAERPHGEAVVHYQCESCLRPFVARHDPTVLVGPAALSEREKAWLQFLRWRLRPV